MRTRAVLALVVLGLVAPLSAWLEACGDKFLRMGVSARMTKYGPIHMASILVYPSARVTATDALGFAALFLDAGYDVDVARHGENLAQRLSGRKYDLILLSARDARTVRDQLRQVATAPALVPVIPEDLDKKARKILTAEFSHVLIPSEMTIHEAYKKLDTIMTARQAAPLPAMSK